MISQMLRDAGVEVIYLGPFQSTETVTAAAVQEDVDVIGLSFLGGDHLNWVSPMLQEMKKQNMGIPLVIGGVIPREDVPLLKDMGVEEVFTAGTPFETIKDYFQKLGKKGR